MFGLFKRKLVKQSEVYAEHLARPPSEGQLCAKRPPIRYGEWNGQKSYPLRWRRVRGVWESYWPCGHLQPVTLYTGRHRCSSFCIPDERFRG